MNAMADRKTAMSHLENVPDEAMDEIMDFIDFVAELHRQCNNRE
jgi:hypothetical protein